MNHFKRSFVIQKPLDSVFDLFSDVRQYHTFIPYCVDSEIIENNDEYTLACLTLDFFGKRTSLTTKNEIETNTSIKMNLIDGPFQHFKAQWTFDAIDDETTDLNFEMEYKISNKLLEFAFNKNLNVVSDSIIRAFQVKLVN